MLDGVVIDNAKLFNDELMEREHFRNYNKPHISLSGLTLYEKLKEKTILTV